MWNFTFAIPWCRIMPFFDNEVNHPPKGYSLRGMMQHAILPNVSSISRGVLGQDYIFFLGHILTTDKRTDVCSRPSCI